MSMGNEEDQAFARAAGGRQPRADPRAGARVNNLKDISVEFLKRRPTVFTGVSGSGKSSLVPGTSSPRSRSD